MFRRSKQSYQRWQTNLFRSGWFAETFVRTMGQFATPIYDWAFELMREDFTAAQDLCDVGCGNGLMSLRVSRDFSGKSFTLVDQSFAQLEAGRRVIMEIASANTVKSYVSPAEELPVESDSVDVLYSTGSINLWTDPVRGLEQCRRTVRDGGVMWFFDQRPCDTPALAFDALFVKRIFGLGLPGYSLEEVEGFARKAGLPAADVIEDMSLYGLRWQL